jgi:nitrite reductase (NO-forming)
VQTTLVPAGGAAIVEFKADVPGRFLLVDHSLSRAMDKGALGSLVVKGDDRPDIFRSLSPEIAKRLSGH